MVGQSANQGACLIPFIISTSCAHADRPVTIFTHHLPLLPHYLRLLCRVKWYFLYYNRLVMLPICTYVLYLSYNMFTIFVMLYFEHTNTSSIAFFICWLLCSFYSFIYDSYHVSGISDLFLLYIFIASIIMMVTTYVFCISYYFVLHTLYIIYLF